MKNKVALFLIILFSSIVIGNILNFIPYNYDLFLHFKNNGRWYNKLKDVPFFEFVLKEEGLSFENYFLSSAERIEKEYGYEKEVLLTSIASDIVFAAKGVTLTLDEMVSFDINYYLDILKVLTRDSIVVFETDKGVLFINYLARLLGLEIKQEQEVYILSESLYSKVVENYVVIAGSKQALDYCINVYKTPELQMKEKISNIINNVEQGDYWITGYSKGDAIKIEMGLSKENDEKTEYVILTGTVENSVFKLNISQKMETERPPTKTEDLMETIPVLGNYFAGISVKESMDVVQIFSDWVSGYGDELYKFYDIANTVLKNATSTFYIVGDLSESTEVSVAFLFKLSDGLDNIDSVIKKYAGYYDDKTGQWIIPISENSNLYFYKFEKFFVVSNISKEIYAKKSSNKRLMNIPAYNYLDKKRNYLLKVFIDIGDIVKKFLGINLNSKLIFWQERDGYFVNYYIEVM
ncbi:hypothetical protein JYK00_03275 [Thermosipho ferrireducens]|uniref:DUF3352 domain-containing protein n=1 Tax=Thermosipho ferrireducens TaxID=2571116 RepID=A0ABX7S8P1_9BACT|nr:hypothetical protein [Thermosipho ferrireducens]QTA38549.1 hypothetical protein JYK00_03275 [Thermosipho ferrireducens]